MQGDCLKIGGQLTYMSIEDEIKDRVKRGMLFPLKPVAPGAAQHRAMFLDERLWAVLNSPEGDEEWEKRVGELQADLERFVTGDAIDPKYLFLLYPARDAVWEIRSVGSDPSIRVLGLFAVKDVFVASNYALRSELGGWQSRKWKEVKRAAIAAWRRLFDPYRPVVTTTIAHLVSGALDAKYFKG